MDFCFSSISEIFLTGDLYIEDSMPPPVCKKARSRRNRKVRGREYCGYCAAKKEKFFGFRLHLMVNGEGVPVSMAILPGAYHDLTPVYEITSGLSENSKAIGDKACNCQDDEEALRSLGTLLMPVRRKNMKKQWPPFIERFLTSMLLVSRWQAYTTSPFSFLTAMPMFFPPGSRPRIKG